MIELIPLLCFLLMSGVIFSVMLRPSTEIVQDIAGSVLYCLSLNALFVVVASMMFEQNSSQYRLIVAEGLFPSAFLCAGLALLNHDAGNNKR